MRIARALITLTRLDTSLLVALAIFIPVFARTRDLSLSLSRAVPLLFIGMCTFVANNLDDIERDRINHPDRPLPSGHVKPELAAALYFSCLMAALFTARAFAPAEIVFWYYFLLATSISYGYIVECFPGFKALYVAVATSVPVLIVAVSYPKEGRLYLVAGAVFLFVLGRELCMDIADRAGDGESFMHRIGERPVAIAAICIQATGLLLLVLQVDELMDVADVFVIAFLLALSSLYWFNLEGRRRRAIFLMKLQLVVGLYFLI